MKKENLMPAVVLTAICVVVAALLAVVNMITAPVIKANAEKKEQESLIEVMPGAEGFTELTDVELTGRVTGVYKENGGMGCVVFLKTRTSYTKGEEMAITVGIGSDGRITGIKITAYSESRDIGKKTYPSLFVGLDDKESEKVDTVTDVTYSSRAFKEALAEAFAFVAPLLEGAPDASTEAEKLIPGSELVTVTPTEHADGISEIWCDKNGGGYVVSTFTVNEYSGMNDTVTLVAVGNDGKVIGIKILTWIHGEGLDYTDKFVSDFGGKDSSGIDGIDAITDATGTSIKIKNAAKLAIAAVEEIKDTELSVLVAEAIIPGAHLTLVTPADKAEGVDRVWYDKTSGGYVVETSTINEYSKQKDTVTIVAVGADGKVSKIEILTWVHGEGLGYTDQFVADFADKDSAGIDGIDAITGATGTANKVKNAAKLAMSAVEAIKTYGIQKTVAENMISGAELEDVTPSDKSEGVDLVWCDKNGGGYVVVTSTVNEYSGQKDTVTLVAVGNDGKVIGIEILTWVHGEGLGYTSKFESDFAGKDTAGIDGIDTITGATGTSLKIRNAAKLAIATVETLKGGN